MVEVQSSQWITPLIFGAVGIVIGLAILLGVYPLIIILIVSLTGYMIWRHEEFGVVLIVVFTASVIYEEQLPSVATAVGNFHLIDLFFFSYLGLILVKRFVDSERLLINTLLDVPLLIFWVIAILSLMLAVVHFNVPVRSALSELRIITYYLIFFAVTNLLRQPQQLRRLVNGLHLIALVVVAFMVLQVSLGHAIHIIPARVESLATMGRTYSDTIRVIPPGNTLIYVMLMIAAATVTIHRMTFVRVGLAMVLLCGLIIGFNRNLWLPAIVMIGLMFLVGTSDHKIRLMIAACGFVFLSMAMVTYVQINDGQLKQYVDSTWDRLWSLTRGRKLVTEGTLIDRVIENRIARTHIMQHPILGIGLGNDYRDDVDWNPKLNAYIHNGYLWILMKMGGLGFIPFMWLLTVGAFRGLKRWKQIPDPFWQSMCLGFTMAHLGMMLSSLVNPVFMQWHSTPLIGIVLGGNELIFHWYPDSAPVIE
ncbi:hypothetical protein JW960_02250 [candidate division KSB1 bacterium]|nr:hypothetical protein [candidate division KSB1 bacterium]